MLAAGRLDRRQVVRSSSGVSGADVPPLAEREYGGLKADEARRLKELEVGERAAEAGGGGPGAGQWRS
jgi:hypothetical protein